MVWAHFNSFGLIISPEHGDTRDPLSDHKILIGQFRNWKSQHKLCSSVIVALLFLRIMYTHTHTHTQKHTPFRPCLHYHELGTLPLSPSSAYRSRFCFGQVGWSHSFGWGEEVTSSFYNFNFNAFSTAVSSYNGLSLLGKRGAGNTVGISPIRGRSIDSGSSLSCLVRNSHLRGQNIVDNFLRGFFLSFDSKYY